MIANTLLEIYTLLFAWNMYEAIWDVLIGSGIALIPLIFAVITNFKDNYESGEAKAVLKSLEITIASMILVLMLCVVPFNDWTVQLDTIKYDLNVADCHPPAKVTGSGDDTETAYDNSFGDVVVVSAKKPVAWGFVEYISSAITHTTITSIGCVNNYEFMLMRVSSLTINDPPLRERLQTFHQACYLTALDRYNVNPIDLPNPLSPVTDIDWLGSRVFMSTFEEYYNHEEAYVTDHTVHGFHRQTVFRDADNSYESGAYPSCAEVWDGEQGTVGDPALGLRDLILEHLHTQDDKAGDILDDWEEWGSQVLTIGVVDDKTKEDLLIRLVLDADAAGLDASTDLKMGTELDVNESKFDKVAGFVTGIVGLVASGEAYLAAVAQKQMMAIAGPMVLAMIQMLIIFSAPFVMVIGKYKIEAFVMIGLTYFTFEFINAIWAIGYFFDQYITDIFLSSAGRVDVALNGLLVMTVSKGNMIIMPAVWLGIMSFAGVGMVRAMGAGGVGGGGAHGAGSFGGAVGKGGRAGKRGYDWGRDKWKGRGK